MAKKKKRGVSPLLVAILTIVAGCAAAAWNYVSYVKTKYEGNHPYWSRQAYLQLDPNSLEHRVAEKVLGSDTLKATAAIARHPAPEDTPVMYGSTRGFLINAWNMHPAMARPAPTPMAAMVLGRRDWKMYSSVVSRS